MTRRYWWLAPFACLALGTALWVGGLEGHLHDEQDGRRADRAAFRARAHRADARAAAADARAAAARQVADEAQRRADAALYVAILNAAKVDELGGQSVPPPAATTTTTTAPPPPPPRCTLNKAGICVPRLPGG